MDASTSVQLHALLYTVAAPAGVVLLATAPVLFGPGQRLRWKGVFVGLGLAAAYAVADFGIRGYEGFPPEDVGRFAPFAGIAAFLAFIAANARKLPGWALLTLRAVVIGAVLFALLRPLLGGWETREAAAVLGAAFVLSVLGWSFVDWAAERSPGPVVPVALAVVTAGLGGVTALAGSVLVGQLAGALAATLGALALLCWLRPGLSLSRTGAGVTVAVLLSLAVYGQHYIEDFPVKALPLLLLGLFQVWVGFGADGSRKAVLRAALLTALACAAPVAIAAAWVFEDQRAADAAAAKAAAEDPTELDWQAIPTDWTPGD